MMYGHGCRLRILFHITYVIHLHLTSLHVPVFQRRPASVGRQVILTGHNGRVVLRQGVFVGVFGVGIEVDKIARQPEIPAAVRVAAFIEHLLPFGIGLPTDTDTFQRLGGAGREVDVQGCPRSMPVPVHCGQWSECARGCAKNRAVR